MNLTSKITYLHGRAINSWDAAGATAEQLEDPEGKDELTILFIRPIVIVAIV